MQREGAGRAALILALIVAVVLAVLLVRHHRQEQQRSAALQAMAEKAEPLEQELARLERELAQAQRSSEQNLRTAFYAVGYQITETADIQFALQHAQEYGFKPNFVLDPTSWRYRTLVSALRDVECELVLTAEPCTESAITSRLQLPESAAASDSGAFLLANADDSEENLTRIAAAGYSCVVRYADNAACTVLENGLATIGYSRIKNADFSVENRLKDAQQNAQTLLIVFDLSALRDGELTEADITDALARIFADRDDGGAQYGTVSEAAAAVRTATEAQAVSRAELDAELAALQQRIDEIRAELDAIYSQWDQGEHR